MAYTKMIAVTQETHAQLKQFAEQKHWDIGYVVEWLWEYYCGLEQISTEDEAEPVTINEEKP